MRKPEWIDSIYIEARISPMSGHSYADTRPIPEYVDDKSPGVRAYRSNPERVMLQIRTYGPTNERATGKPKAMMSSIPMTPAEAEKLGAFLLAWAQRSST